MEDATATSGTASGTTSQLSEAMWLRCCRNLDELLRDRGWQSVQWSATAETLYNQFCRAKAQVVLLATVTQPTEQLAVRCRETASMVSTCAEMTLLVYMCLSRNFTSPAAQNIELLRHGSSHVMVLFQDKITALRKDNSIEVKPMNALYINPPQHRLVPRHRLLEPAEEEALLERLMCVREKLPVIFVTDPVVRYYDFPLNRIIEILRPSPYYRCIRAGIAKGNYDKFFVK